MTFDESRLSAAWQELAWPLAAAVSCVPWTAYEGTRDAWSQSVLPDLPEAEWQAFERIGSENRRWEWVAGKIARERVKFDLLQLHAADGPRILTSLSHCSDLAVCIGVQLESEAAAPGGLRGIGVDLERSDREMHPAVVERAFTAQELRFPISPLIAWVIKEACFKADPANAGKVVWATRITAISPSGEGEATGPSGVSCRFRWLQSGDWISSFAVATAERG